MNNNALLDGVKKAIIPYYECTDCRRRLEEGEFIAIVGATPPTGLSMPIGRTDVIFEKVGAVYCKQCFNNRF